MIAIVCLDDACGMLFGGKRQSRDSKVLEDISNHYGEVAILPFSEKMFKPSGVKYTVKNSLDEVAKDETVFVENQDLSLYKDKITKLIVYKWNRLYPSDFKFTLKLSDFKKKSVAEFVGSSHDKITREEYLI